ncbi:MAG: hypothetical protein GXX84_00355 [Acidobacteria bacterium]|nr:hypothetical protein [Acidobacteriota bacterium]
MLSVLPFLLLIPIAGTAFCAWRRMMRRIAVLEGDLKAVSDAMFQMTALQMKSHEKVSGRFEEIEERIMELSVPSHDSSLPLERRHQVLSLSRQGVEIGEIVRRLKAPVGEAELILNLSRYAGGGNSRPGSHSGQVRQYA